MTHETQIVDIESITTDPEFRGVLLEKALVEYTELRESIKAEGIRNPLVVGVIDQEEYLLDGHHRLQSGEELGIKEVPVIKMHFANRAEAKMWIVRNQIMCRNLNTFQRIEAALQFKDYFSAKAKENQRAAGGAAVPETFQEAVDTYKELAKIAGTSDTNVRKVEKILQRASKKDINALRKGEARVSINSVYQACLGKTNPSVKRVPKPKAKPADEILPVPQSTEGLEPEQEEQPQSLEEPESDDDSILDYLNGIVEGKPSDQRILFLDRMSEWVYNWKDSVKAELSPPQE
jgi:hypothetical protein